MFNIKWDQTGERFFETGIDRGVLFVADKGTYPKGVAWNGLTQFSENPTGAEPQKQYADNINYLTLMSAEEMEGTLEAFTYPKEWGECDGSATLDGAPGLNIGQQVRKMFGLSYRTLVGNDVDGQDHGYIIHLLYGALASPSEKSYQTVNDTPEAITFSWDISTTPVNVGVEGLKPTALLTIDSRTADAAKLAELESILYGVPGATEEDEGVQGRLPLPNEIIEILKGA